MTTIDNERLTLVEPADAVGMDDISITGPLAAEAVAAMPAGDVVELRPDRRGTAGGEPSR